MEEDFFFGFLAASMLSNEGEEKMAKAAKTTKPSGNVIEKLREEVMSVEKDLMAKGTYTPEAQAALNVIMGLIDKYR